MTDRPTVWRRASASGPANNCVELATWRTSSASQEGQCVELATALDRVGIRDSKAPQSGRLLLPDTARGALLAFTRR